jgi:hypothetical protein
LEVVTSKNALGISGEVFLNFQLQASKRVSTWCPSVNQEPFQCFLLCQVFAPIFGAKKVVKDIRKMIGKIIWDAREEAAYLEEK